MAARAARAQQQAASIGFLSPSSIAGSARNIAAFRQGLSSLGYVDGRDLAIEYRFAEGIWNVLQRFATELVALKPRVIVVGSTTGIVSASKVTQSLPLIMVGATEDPVRLGLAKNFSHPGGNVTGFPLTLDQELLGKKLQLLRDAIPGSRAWVSWWESSLPRCCGVENSAFHRRTDRAAISSLGGADRGPA